MQTIEVLNKDLTLCDHCSQPVLVPYKVSPNNKEVFCCQGCLTVFQILHENNLDYYYQLKNGANSPVQVSSENYDYLEEESFLKETCERHGDHTLSLSFHLEGIYCHGCVWLLENLHKLDSSVLISRFNLSTNVIEVRMNETGSFKKIAQLLNTLGYKPHVITDSSNQRKLQKKADQKMLIRIGIAGAATGNIMLYATSIYSGASGFIEQHFNWISGIIAIPAFFYSGLPFYESTFQAIRSKRLSIDIPIFVAVFVGALVSYTNLFIGSPDVYFDSVTALIFLLLASRFVLKRIERKSFELESIEQYLYSGSILKQQDDGTYKEILPKDIQVNDLVLVKTGKEIPVDGEVVSGESLVNQSLLTGESAPAKIKIGQRVFQGTLNLENDFVVKVLAKGKDSRLGKMLKDLSLDSTKPNIVTFTDIVAQYFLIAVFSISALIVLYFGYHSQWMLGIERALTMMIVTCPCALGIGTPLTFNRSFNLLFDRGILIKNTNVLERILKSKKIFLDKTGTLTHGNYQVSKMKVHGDHAHLADIIYRLENYSKHPMAFAIKSYLKEQNLLTNPANIHLENYQELIGMGVQGEVENRVFAIKRLDKNEQNELGYSTVGVYRNNELICEFHLNDDLRKDSTQALKTLKQMGFETFILSGDTKNAVEKVAKTLSLDQKHYFAQVSPEIKKEILQQNPLSIMVGDGANDALSLKEASVGIAVKGSMDISLRVSDIFLTRSGISPIVELLVISNETLKIIKRNLYLSAWYNVVAGALAVMGFITPLLAAIVMPLSSLTVVLSNYFGTKTLRDIKRSQK
jgi:heavy metal translocating P-type ATPase